MRISFVARRIIFNVHFPCKCTYAKCMSIFYSHTQQRQQHQNIAININEIYSSGRGWWDGQIILIFISRKIAQKRPRTCIFMFVHDAPRVIKMNASVVWGWAQTTLRRCALREHQLYWFLSPPRSTSSQHEMFFQLINGTAKKLTTFLHSRVGEWTAKSALTTESACTVKWKNYERCNLDAFWIKF